MNRDPPDALLDGLPVMIYRRRDDADGTLEYVSAGCAALTGYAPGDVVSGRKLGYVELVHPADRSQLAAAIQRAARQGAPFQATYRIRTAAGDERWVRDHGRSAAGPDGGVAAIEGVISDATEERRTARLLEDRAAESDRDLTTLLEIARNLAAMLDLEPLLDLILEQARAAVDYHGAGILIVQGELLVQFAARGPDPERVAEGIRLNLAEADLLQRTLDAGRPLVIADVWSDDPTAREYRQAVGEQWLRARSYIRSWVGLPLRFRGRRLGLMVITYGKPGHFTEHHVRLLTAVAAQAAVAIENARLVAAARQAAALEERQRLARDLHDAVTQTLFSASLVGDVLPTLWARNPERGAEALADLRALTRAALAEMRTLLFELRPGALVETPLGDLLRHLADAVAGQSRLPVTVRVDGIQPLPADVQVAFYRIAQEALNNVVKHARAHRAGVEVTGSPRGAVRLRIHDDGRGLDPNEPPPGHFGLATMHERAEAIGATLAIVSAPGHGTEIVLDWPGHRPATPAPEE